MKLNVVTNWTLMHCKCLATTLLNLILNDRLASLLGVLILSQSHNHKSKI